MARIITPEAILSYPNLFTPRAANPGDDEKYSVSLVFPAGTDLSALESAAATMLKEKFGKKADALLLKVIARRKGKTEEEILIAGGIRWPFRQDWESKGYPEGSTFLNVRSTRPPQVVSVIPDENGNPSRVTDESRVYPGVIARASIDPFTYDVSGNKGVTFGLGNVQIIRDGDRLDGNAHASAEFDADPGAIADLSDLDGVDQVEAEVEADEPEDVLSDLVGG